VLGGAAEAAVFARGRTEAEAALCGVMLGRSTIMSHSGPSSRHFRATAGWDFSGVGGPASSSTMLVGETT